MAHQLETSTDMIFNSKNGLPWHGLGTPLDGLATMDEVLTACPALAAKVNLEQVTRNGEDVTGKFFTVREDNDRVLGIVGSRYRVLQNADAFRFFDAVTQDPHGPKYETAGILYGGTKVFLLAKLPETPEVVPGDPINQFILLANSHDGSSPVIMLETPVRVVCQNTLNAALRSSDKSKQSRLRHSGNILGKVKDVQDALGIIRADFAETIGIYQDLAKKEPSKEDIEKVLEKLFPATETARAENQKARFNALFEGAGQGSNLKGVRGTAWGMYNAFTELEDHYNNLGSTREDAADMRSNGILFGAARTRKEDALATIREVVGV